ncbi:MULTISPECIES: ArsC family reductase [Novosphingobium]|uniref:ArsC family reductase n=1 Tax=Novosphingobium decolorationis TaxID=2698673 RepID=A0ABX8EB88_9SPHN|nr:MULTISPECIES: ArsC family reductase [Novosphingobium]MED5544491.1 ArsC family reductase [Pseudomonadota bacterium]QVM85445.1 ArsC family reductase [Novosphingobium decolorationis]GAM03295.1 ArsC family transcriptional regulator [Novosphingobium sp. MBES04]
MSLEVYGIPNCDTVKKARKWLEARDIEYTFHDYKKEGADPQKLAAWVEAEGVETVLNTRGTTFRKLSDEDKADIDAAKAVRIMAEHTSTIKRPVVEHAKGILVGFNQMQWEAVLK